METRKEFINRMQWMALEVKQSDLDDSNILPMLEYQLRLRERDLLRDTQRRVICIMEVSKEYTNHYIIKKGRDKFLDIIDSL